MVVDDWIVLGSLSLRNYKLRRKSMRQLKAKGVLENALEAVGNSHKKELLWTTRSVSVEPALEALDESK